MPLSKPTMSRVEVEASLAKMAIALATLQRRCAKLEKATKSKAK